MRATGAVQMSARAQSRPGGLNKYMYIYLNTFVGVGVVSARVVVAGRWFCVRIR